MISLTYCTVIIAHREKWAWIGILKSQWETDSASQPTGCLSVQIATVSLQIHHTFWRTLCFASFPNSTTVSTVCVGLQKKTALQFWNSVQPALQIWTYKLPRRVIPSSTCKSRNSKHRILLHSYKYHSHEQSHITQNNGKFTKKDWLCSYLNKLINLFFAFWSFASNKHQFTLQVIELLQM